MKLQISNAPTEAAQKYMGTDISTGFAVNFVR